MKSFLYLLYTTHSVVAYEFFNHWTCIGIPKNIDFTNPYVTNIGELPLVVWKDPSTNKIISTINICKHMGSKLDNAKIVNGCMKCPYHGLEYKYEDRIGETMEYEGKLFWAYNPTRDMPYSVPHYADTEYVTSHLEIDMDCSLTDSAYNSMDLRHPEYVHNKILGFGNSIPPSNIKSHKYDDTCEIGLSFDYHSKLLLQKINDNVKITHNFHKFMYPTFSWSKVSIGDKNLVIGVNFLPLSQSKTRWYITLCHNYYKSTNGKQFMQFLATAILNQDRDQMKNQAAENDLKKQILFNHVFKDEEAILEIRNMFEKYQYPTTKDCIDMYINSNKKS